ncbi:hypothetical protein MHYP_G00019310 [Metynnis hypsauchen]
MKSDWSMGNPAGFSSGPVASAPDKRSAEAALHIHMDTLMVGTGNLQQDSYQPVDDVLHRVLERHKSSIKNKLENGGKIRMKRGLKKYACDLTLDPNTAHSCLSLSEENRKAKNRDRAVQTHRRRARDRDTQRKLSGSSQRSQRLNMGFAPSKPEFVTVFADKHVKLGEDVTLRCEANTEELTATWEKNGQKLYGVEGHISMKQGGKLFILEINKAEEKDEGRYALNLKNKQGEASCSAVVTVELSEWRTVQWTQDGMINYLKAFKMSNDKVDTLHFLLYGPTGSGKSSVIDTIKTTFEGHLFINFLAASEISDTSHTKRYEKCNIGKDGLLPFAFHDIMGLEKEDKGGVHTHNIISALKGHMKEGYVFNSTTRLTENDPYYLKNPSVSDKIHCLVNIIPADTISMIKEDFIQNMKKVREEASSMGLPQVIFMTRVDRACPLTKRDLRSIYKSRKIKEKMRECSIGLGVPMNCIFPVWNYHEETEIKEEINCLMLHALTKIVHFADDYIVKCSEKQTSKK